MKAFPEGTRKIAAANVQLINHTLNHPSYTGFSTVGTGPAVQPSGWHSSRRMRIFCGRRPVDARRHIGGHRTATTMTMSCEMWARLGIPRPQCGLLIHRLHAKTRQQALAMIDRFGAASKAMSGLAGRVVDANAASPGPSSSTVKLNVQSLSRKVAQPWRQRMTRGALWVCKFAIF
jgi:hypothetical protein